MLYLEVQSSYNQVITVLIAQLYPGQLYLRGLYLANSCSCGATHKDPGPPSRGPHDLLRTLGQPRSDDKHKLWVRCCFGTSQIQFMLRVQ